MKLLFVRLRSALEFVLAEAAALVVPAPVRRALAPVRVTARHRVPR